MIQSTFALKNSIGLTGVRNARELGGYRTSDGRVVRHGCLLRTGKLENMTDADRDRLLGTYHLKKIIDLRSPGEISRSPEPVLPGTEYINSAPLGSIFRCYVPAIDCRTPEGRNYLRSIFRSLLQLDRKGDLMKNYYTAGYNQICTTQQGIEAAESSSASCSRQMETLCSGTAPTGRIGLAAPPSFCSWPSVSTGRPPSRTISSRTIILPTSYRKDMTKPSKNFGIRRSLRILPRIAGYSGYGLRNPSGRWSGILVLRTLFCAMPLVSPTATFLN